MNPLLNTLKNLLNQSIKNLFPTLPANFQAIITRATDPKFGHFQCNSAMPLSKVLKMPPRDIAQTIVDALLALPNHPFQEVSLAGPGFINITLSSKAITESLQSILNDEHLGVTAPEHPERIVIDFSSPNVAKEMHVGHLRSTIIGDCLARTLEWVGHDVLRLNHVGDWGTAFGMLIAYLKADHPRVLSGEETPSLSDLMNWYRASKYRFDENSEFKEASRLQVVALQKGEPEAFAAWQLISKISYDAYHQIYQLLDIKLTDRGESFYNPWLADTVELLNKKGLLTESQGAQCVFLEGYVCKDKQPMPMIVEKSDGGFNYTTTDLTALRQRVNDEKAERIIYVTDQGQQLHFKMIFECGRLAGFAPDTVQLDHVPFGLVLGADGKKLKTRSGNVEKLADLLQEAINRACVIMTERHPDWENSHTHEQATQLGLAAVKYADLSNHRQSDYQFSYDKMLAFDGNTAAFILYANVRTISIKNKSQLSPAVHLKLTEPSEIDLALQLLNFGNTIAHVASELMPNRLTDYLYQLAILFNRFFHDCPVIGGPQEAERLALIDLTHRVLNQGLILLGIKPLDEM